MGTWKFDPMHLQVEFSAKHLGMMTVRVVSNEIQVKIEGELVEVPETKTAGTPSS